MSNPFIGEIRVFGGNFAPVGWLSCNGQLVSIDEFSALFALIGTTYGGDGQTTFALPDLRGRAPVQAGSGPGVTQVLLGEAGGAERVTLNPSQIPPHSHAVRALGSAASATTPNGNLPAGKPRGGADIYAPASSPPVALAPGSVGPAGANQPHENMQPSLAMNFIIAVFGIFPSRP